MTPHDELFDNVAAYALGVLPAPEASEVEQHLQTCERCREEYRFLRPAVTAVAYSAEGVTDAAAGSAVASPLLKARVMNRVRAEAARQSRPRLWPAYALAAACLAVAIATGLVNVALNARLQRETAQANAQAQMIADLSATDAQRYSFARGAVITRDGRLYLAMNDLPPLPSGRTYQAWTLAHGATKVAPSVTFEPTSGVTVVRLPESALTTTAVAVSVEPAGGSQQPTTKPVAFVRI
jgi:anti-sigma-K factor RskA